jgi:predicted transposase YbfD/YdcC
VPLPDPEHPELPEATKQERLLRLTLPDAHLTVVQERANKARHGRYETRTLWALSSAELNGYLGSAGEVGKPWPGVRQVCRIQRVRVSKDRKSGEWKTTAEVDYSITSLRTQRAEAAELLKRWRVHWHIENRLHWVRDVTFGEDGCPINKGQAPEVFAVLRNAAISMLEWSGSPTIAAAARELGARPSAPLEFFASLTERLKAVSRSVAEKAPSGLLGPSVKIPASQPTPATQAMPRDGPLVK